MQTVATVNILRTMDLSITCFKLCVAIGCLHWVVAVCPQIRRCDVCLADGSSCIQCEENFQVTKEQQQCCSKGCEERDSDGFHMCNTTNGHCLFENCQVGSYPPECLHCNLAIQYCDKCGYTDDVLHCSGCVTGFDVTTSGTKCCPTGCDGCTGTNLRTCTVCKAGYNLYNTVCDTCGNNCFPPADDSPRCNAVTGVCHKGCNSGWTGSRCDVLCDLNNCDTCTYDELARKLTCADCAAGYYGDTCGRCSSTCLVDNDNELCSQSGVCIHGCIPAHGAVWYGPQCKLRCPDTCVGQICDRNGTCHWCLAGKYGTSCQLNCGDHCGIAQDGTTPCDIDGGRCSLDDCETTWYGPQCQFRCPAECVDQKCDRNGACTDGCDTGMYGTTCQLNCVESRTCNDGKCDQETGSCRECEKDDPSFICRTADCPNGMWGLNCDNQCPPNCEDGTCQRYTRECTSCLNTYYGATCNLTCPNCVDDVCIQRNGVCTKSCKDGWYTPVCTNQCLQTGCQDCDISTGECTNCKTGWYGQRCDGRCSDRCKGRSCSITDTNCLNGCTDGYWGSKCEFDCNVNCEGSACNTDSSVCLYGCNEDKFWGDTCSIACNKNCFHGTCNRTGYCLDTCRVGFYGNQCEFVCSSNCNGANCDRISGLCDICSRDPNNPKCSSDDGSDNTWPIVGGAAGGVVILAVTVAVVVLIVIKKRRKNATKQERTVSDSSGRNDVRNHMNGTQQGQETSNNRYMYLAPLPNRDCHQYGSVHTATDDTTYTDLGSIPEREPHQYGSVHTESETSGNPYTELAPLPEREPHQYGSVHTASETSDNAYMDLTPVPDKNEKPYINLVVK